MALTPEQLRTEGRADAAVMLYARRVMPLVSLEQWADYLGVTAVQMQAAVRRHRERQLAAGQGRRPNIEDRPQDHTTPAVSLPEPAPEPEPPGHPCDWPGCTARYSDRRGLATHRRSHQSRPCRHCYEVIPLPGLPRHEAFCSANPENGGTPE